MITYCVCCQKRINTKPFARECFEICSGNYICKDCAEIINIKNWFLAGFHTKNQVLKKYAKANPQAKVWIDEYFSQTKQKKNAIQEEKNSKSKNSNRRNSL